MECGRVGVNWRYTAVEGPWQRNQELDRSISRRLVSEQRARCVCVKRLPLAGVAHLEQGGTSGRGDMVGRRRPAGVGVHWVMCFILLFLMCF